MDWHPAGSGRVHRRAVSPANCEWILRASARAHAGTLYVGTLDEGLEAVPLREEKPRPTEHPADAGSDPIMAFTEIADGLLAISPDTIRHLPGKEPVVPRRKAC